MSLHKKILEDAKQAMLKREEPRLMVLKGIKAAFTNELLAKKGKPQAELSDEEALAVLRRLVKQRKDSIEQFGKGGRQDLVKNETAELKVLETYLPAQMSEDDIKKIAEKKKAELGVTDKTKIGQLVGAVLKETKGLAEGGEVKRIIEKLFN